MRHIPILYLLTSIILLLLSQQFVTEVSQSHVCLNDAAAFHTVLSVRLKLLICLFSSSTKQTESL